MLEVLRHWHLSGTKPLPKSKCWSIANWTPKKKLQWIWTQNTKHSIRWFSKCHLQNGDHFVSSQCPTLKRNWCHIDGIFITGCTGRCNFDNFQCSQWWNFRQNDAFQWRQFTGVPMVYSTVCSGGDQRKHKSSASLAFARGIHRWFPSQRVSYAENVSIWWRHLGHFRFNVYTYGVHPPTRRICSFSPGSHVRRSSLCFIDLVLSVSTTPGHNTPIRTPVLSLPIKRCRKQTKRSEL